MVQGLGLNVANGCAGRDLRMISAGAGIIELWRNAGLRSWARPRSTFVDHTGIEKRAAPPNRFSANVVLRILDWLAPLAFPAIILCSVSPNQSLSKQADEGINLMKGMLYTKGFHLYREIWSDQPPIFTLLMAACYKIFGPNIQASRLVVLTLSTILIWSLYHVVRRLQNSIAAITAILFVAGSAWFIQLSLGVLIGLPALALGMLSLWMISEWRISKSYSRRLAWFWSSIPTMVVAIQTKFFALTILPSAATLILLPMSKFPKSAGTGLPADLGEYPPPSQTSGRARLAAFWLFAVGLITIGFGFAMSENAQQLLADHWIAMEKVTSGGFTFPTLFQKITDSAAYLCPLAMIGIFAAVIYQRFQILVPVLWLATTTAVLMVHRPLWYHYAPLLVIPLAWLASTGMSALMSFAKISFRSFLANRLNSNEIATKKTPALNWLNIAKLVSAIALVIAVILVTLMALWNVRDGLDGVKSANIGLQPADAEVVAQLKRYGSQTHWVFADFPIYPYAAGLPVPPELAVFSEKRRETGFMSDDALLSVLQKYQPEQVLVGRFIYDDAVMTFLGDHYEIAWRSEDAHGNLLQQYVARSIINSRRAQPN
jgi:hypothetical protein